jgi:hypothetical protein
MKKMLLTIVAVFLFAVTYSQAVQRSVVILEIGTGTGCPYCPGSAISRLQSTNWQQLQVPT